MVNQDRNVFAACMVAHGHGDGMVTGVTRSYHVALEDVGRVLDARPGEMRLGLSIAVMRERTVFIADSTVTELPTPRELADIACQSAAKAREMGHEPRVALLSFSTYGNPLRERGLRGARGHRNPSIRGGWTSNMMARSPPMSRSTRRCASFTRSARLSGPANVLVMPRCTAPISRPNCCRSSAAARWWGPC